MTWSRDWRTIREILRPLPRGLGHAARLEAFYAGQARDYDAFRERLLPGRRELVAHLPLRPGGVWVDLGGGTAFNLLSAGPSLASLARVIVLDLTASLLEIARRRVHAQGWTNVSLVRGDATDAPLPDGIADIVTCSYALTMIPDWRKALDEALRLLKPGGTFGAVDFHVSPRHGAVTRAFWPRWFGQRGVRLDARHLPAVQARFTTRHLVERRAPVPYLPGGRVPYYLVIGQRG